MNREIIELTEFEIAPILCEYAIENEEYEEFFDEDGNIVGDPIWNDFKIIDCNVIYYSIEKGYDDRLTIVKRKSDGKYFKGQWVFSHHIENEYDTTLTEVFPKEKTIIVYE